MHFTASTSDFGKALGLARSCAPQKSTVPILSHFLVRADERGLAITASDLDREVTIRCAANVKTNGLLAIEGGMLTDIVGRAGGTEVTVKSDDGKVKISSGRSNFNVPTLEPDDFPLLGQPEGAAEYTLTGGEFQRAAMRVLFAAATDVTAKGYLCCVHVHPDDNSWVCVAADGPQLARVAFPAPNHGQSLSPFSLPPKTAHLAGKIFGSEDIAMRIGERLVSFTSPSASLVSKLIDGSFPDYGRVIPTDVQTVRVNRAELADSVARVAVAGGDLGVLLEFNGETLRLSSRKGMGADGADEMGLLSPAKPAEATIHPQIMASILGIFSEDEVFLGLENVKKPTGNPIIVHGGHPGTLAILMSMVSRNILNEARAA
jgi:DNA polymerase-3 subunit beta